MATRKIKTNKNKKIFRRTRSKKHRGGVKKTRYEYEADDEGENVKKIANKKVKKPHQIFDGLDFTDQMDDILVIGNVGDEIEYISNNQIGVEKYIIILNAEGEKESQFVSGYGGSTPFHI